MRSVAMALLEAVVHCDDEIAVGRVAVLLAFCARLLRIGALLILLAMVVAACNLLLLCSVAFLERVVMRSPTITAASACLGLWPSIRMESSLCLSASHVVRKTVYSCCVVWPDNLS